jgi:hypothetical protein
VWWATNRFCICSKLIQQLIKDGIQPKGSPSNLLNGFNESYYNKSNGFGMTGNPILLNGISSEQLIELLRPMIRDEVRRVFSEQEEKLISPKEACKLFKPAITKATLTSWTEKGWLQEHRIGGRVYYLQSEILASTLKLGKYRNYRF